MVQGPRDGPCLAAVPAAGERTQEVIVLLARVMERVHIQPAVLQTDRGPCFMGAEGGGRSALPGRLTLWLWGLGIHHRLLPPGQPYRNGAVERLNGAIERSWTGEDDGLMALVTVWNVGKPDAAVAAPPYAGRDGFSLARVWEGLEQTRVVRSVDGQGKLSVWDRPLRVGQTWATRSVVVTFEAARRVAVIRDKRGALVVERELPWLTANWLWDGTHVAPVDAPPVAPLALDLDGTSIL